MGTPDEGTQREPAGELEHRETEEQASPRPDQARPRGNPQIEDIDVDRGLGKMERVSGN